uniref:Uncharacterized protein n=1 Tax=viral metagenome TaxID=1070528 RepID=A0A6C0AE95_9ZZZZ
MEPLGFRVHSGAQEKLFMIIYHLSFLQIFNLSEME